MSSIMHIILAGTTVGIILLTSLLFFVHLFMKGSFTNSVNEKLHFTIYILSLIGCLYILVSFSSGFFGTWSMDAVYAGLLAQNKTILSILLLAAWFAFTYLLLIYKESFWNHSLALSWGTFLVVSSALSCMFLGSMGGSATTKGTIFEPFFQAFGINRYIFLSESVLFIILFIGGAGAAVVLGKMKRKY